MTIHKIESKFFSTVQKEISFQRASGQYQHASPIMTKEAKPIYTPDRICTFGQRWLQIRHAACGNKVFKIGLTYPQVGISA